MLRVPPALTASPGRNQLSDDWLRVILQSVGQVRGEFISDDAV